MSVVPFNATSVDVYIRVDLVLVVDIDLSIVKIANELETFLHKHVGLKLILRELIHDPKALKYLLKSENVVFILGKRYHVNEHMKKVWLEELNANMQGATLKQFSVYLLDSPTSKPNNTPSQREIHGYEHTFQWLPFLLKAIIGTTGTAGKRPKIIDIAEDKKTSTEYIDSVNEMLDALGVGGKQPPSDDNILLFHDTVKAEDKQRFRNAKLNRNFIHSFAIIHYSSDKSLCWFTSRQSGASDTSKFILLLMFDLGLIDVKSDLQVTDKIPAIQIATPIEVKETSESSVSLKWKRLAKHEDKSRIVVKQRSENSSEWSQICDDHPGSVSTYTAGNLQQHQKYQFSLVVESYDNVSEPTYSEWISIEENGQYIRNGLIKALWIALLIFIVVLDIPECFLLGVGLTFLIILLILIGLASVFLLFYKGKGQIIVIAANIIPYMWDHKKECIVCIYIFFLVGYLSTAWLIPNGDSENGTIPFYSPIYIIPPAYMLLWSIIGNIVSHKVFECTYGVLSIPGKILNKFKLVGLDVRVHGPNEV